MKNPAHRQILQKVPRQIQNWITIRHLGVDLLLWAALLGGRQVSADGWMGALLAVLFCAFCFRSFGMMHECVHSAAASSRDWNDALGNFYGIFCFLPFRSWQDVHLNHHIWTGNVEKDPSTRLLYLYKKNGFKISDHVATAWKLWIPLLAFLQHIVFWRATRSKSEGIFVAASVMFLFASSYVLGPGVVLGGLITYLYTVEIINFPHHLGLEQFEGDARFSAQDQARFTRSCVYPRWFARHVLLNFNLHTEHHLFPAHPWYALERLRVEMQQQNMIENNGGALEWILENRSRPLSEVFAKSFPNQQKDAA